MGQDDTDFCAVAVGGSPPLGSPAAHSSKFVAVCELLELAADRATLAKVTVPPVAAQPIQTELF